MRAYALNGYFDNAPHGAVPTDAVNISRALRKVGAMTSSASSTGDKKKSATSGTTSATTKPTSSTTTKTTASAPTKSGSNAYRKYSSTDIYKVGDEIADALVFSVASKNKKGKMVLKKVFTADCSSSITNHLIEINKRSNSEYGYVHWRVATVAEYYTLFKQGYIKIEQKRERKRVIEVFGFCSLPVQTSGFIAYDGGYDNMFARDNEMYRNSSFHGFGPGQGIYSYLLVADFR